MSKEADGKESIQKVVDVTGSHDEARETILLETMAQSINLWEGRARYLSQQLEEAQEKSADYDVALKTIRTYADEISDLGARLSTANSMSDQQGEEVRNLLAQLAEAQKKVADLEKRLRTQQTFTRNMYKQLVGQRKVYPPEDVVVRWSHGVKTLMSTPEARHFCMHTVDWVFSNIDHIIENLGEDE